MVINLKIVAFLLGPAILAVGMLAAIPAIYAIAIDSKGFISFATVSCLCVVISQILKTFSKGAKQNINIRELFLFTISLWSLMTLIAAIPFWIQLDDIDYAAAIFEAASGLSTTGGTAISYLETRPEPILLWRSILQFLGGIGFVVIAVAVLPNVSLGGMNLFKTESTSFDGSAKITPHIKTMALSFLTLYLVLLCLCTLFYYLGGLNLFLAINAALCTVATGGMMPLDSSMTNMSPMVHYTAIVFMILGSLPFILTIGLVTGHIKAFFKDEQVRFFFFIIIAATFVVCLSLIIKNGYDVERAFRVSLFNIVSVLSTSGFGLEDFTAFNSVATLIFLIILPIGGCSGSTSGGIKIFRIVVGLSLFKAQLKKTIHPHGVVYPRYNGNIVHSDTLSSIITYFVAYILALLISTFIATLYDIGLLDAISGSISCLSNIGPALGPQFGPSGNFANIPNVMHVIFAIDMLIGRLEIIPFLLCLSPDLWRR